MKKGKCTECGEIKSFMYASDVCSDCIEKLQTETCGMNKLPWTKELPQKSGLYWISYPEDVAPVPVAVVYPGKGGFVVFPGDNRGYTFADFDKILPGTYWLPMDVPDPPAGTLCPLKSSPT